jgi:hypothetical protein
MRTKSVVKALLAGAVLLLLAEPAFALSVAPYFAGKGMPSPFNFSQFNMNQLTKSGTYGVNGAVVGYDTPPSTSTWFIPLAVNEGLHTVTVEADSDGYMSCTLQAVNQDGSPYQAEGWYPAKGYSFGILQVSSPNSGALYLTCDLSGDEQIVTVNYNE